MASTGKNTISTKTYRDKYRLAALDTILRAGLVGEKVCMVDRSDEYTLQSPYGSQPVTVISALTGTYAVADYTTTDSTLTVNNEFKVAEQVYDFENSLGNFDLFANRADEQMYSVMTAIDGYVVNGLANGATGAYTTPVGGFTTAANVGVIFANIISKLSGYSEVYKGMYCIVENTDLTGIIQYQSLSGFSYADAALNNGFVTNIMGVDVYVVRSGTYAATVYQDFTGATGVRVAGVKNVATYAAPRGVQFEEKGVSAKTGKEVVTYGYCGMKVWGAKAALTIKITLA